jgi:HPt (histidine-containing phosphotransfer) domain-containing protein
MERPAPKPIDLDHLNIYTGGDRKLNCQILGLFDGQCREIIEKLAGLAEGAQVPDGGENWHEIVHSLKGAARGVGAFTLGEIAAEAEKMKLSDKTEVLEVVARLKANAAIVHRFVDDLINQSA